MSFMPAMREISNPLGVIDDLFAASTKGSVLNPPREWCEKAHFIQALQLEDEDNFRRVPCLNDADVVESLPPFSLVRYRCMVQDVFDPEMYTAYCVEKNANGQGLSRPVSLKYRERLPATGGEFEDLGNSALGMRGAFYCVPLPGETAWALEQSGAQSGGPPNPQAVQAAAVATGTKRCRRDDDVDMEACPDMRAAISTSVLRPRHGTQNVNPCLQEIGKNSDTFGLNLPLPWEEEERRAPPCIVKLYDADEDALKLGETLEVMGILCVDPAMANLGETPAWTLGADARDPSTALVPRLHGLVVRKLPCYHPMFPFTPSWLSEQRLCSAFQRHLAAPGALAAARGAALSLLQKCLGDDLAAEYVLALLASGAAAHAGDVVPGKWALNLTQFDTSQVAGLLQAIQELMPRAVSLSVTTESLNKGRWIPRKDFDANRLLAGKLQLSGGTVLVLDETQLSEGKLHEEGVRSLQAIQSIVSSRTLPCVFGTYTMEVPTDITSIVASKRASVLKTDAVVLPLSSKAMNASDVPANLDASRFLLGLITRQTRRVRLSEDVTTALSKDYVQMRDGFQEIGQATLSSWVSLANAICLSHGEDELSLTRWRSVFELEKQRVQRCVDAGLMHRRG